ncbi:hypothetical protein DM01DRAFT_1331211 [Hesseltinella vesiculosa]|uniref:BHLH domain-containing protein n=1 Tax=Hesseltinella vesiculosa TaxID=101127 RepID=A0A1X2GYH9_9FUNG|nr:hypothetical protein DM01DRAFT_1331211 [Hesseltinella vesiculosa]
MDDRAQPSTSSSSTNSTASSPLSTPQSSMPTSNQVLYLNFSSKTSNSPSSTTTGQQSTRKTSAATNRGTKSSKKSAYRVNGVNILNRKDVDSRTVVERIQRRREYHNYVERRRRDTINNTILALSEVVPDAIQPGQKPHKGKILKATLDYIMQLQGENDIYRQQYGDVPSAQVSPDNSPPTMTLPTTPASMPPMMMALPLPTTSGSRTPTPMHSPSMPPPPLTTMTPPPLMLDPVRPALPTLAPRPVPLLWDTEKRYRNTCHY